MYIMAEKVRKTLRKAGVCRKIYKYMCGKNNAQSGRY